MAWLVELLVSTFARPLLAVILALFGYDLDWSPRDGHSLTGWRLVFAVLLCCALTAAVLGCLVWLMWRFSR